MSVDMRLNLLDASQEPSDEQLDALMESMIAKVRAESEAADSALAETLRMAMEQVDEASA